MVHDIFIGTVIIIILLAQFWVFNHASTKVKLFKDIIPNHQSFKMVKVYIPESKIKSLTVEEVFKNEHFYMPNSFDEEQEKIPEQISYERSYEILETENSMGTENE